MSDFLECNPIPDHGSASYSLSGCYFERRARTEDDSGHPPRPQAVIYPDYQAFTVEKDDVNRETHEEHVHPHERLEPTAVEKHPLTGFEPLSSEQAAGLAAEPSGIVESGTEDR
jgi:hypothetical protein